jgi:phage shock protein PspC (stress-responsive transcriptional regulator)
MSNSPNSPVRRLTLSTTDKKIAGVCGGIAEYFNIDPTLVRVITVVLVLFFGGGLLAYLLAWIIMPKPAPTG